MCHLDHHETMDKYVDAKMNIAKRQGFRHHIVYNMDNPYLKDINKIVLSNPVGFSYQSTISRIYVLNDYLYFKNKRIYRLSKNDLTCKHKIENYLAVLTVISLMDFNLKRACRLLKSFKDIKYRLTKIDTYVYNDAKSTNCGSTIAAIHSLSNVHLICGGYNRGMKIALDYGCLSKLNCVYAYGQTKDMIKEYFEDKNIECYSFASLEEALKCAYSKRKEKEVILYSPMFASFDQYQGYEQRGEEFDRIYYKLKHKKN